MYHRWGSQNVWLRQIHGSNKLFLSESIWKANNFEEGDWAKLTSENSSIVVPVALMKGQNENTVWTWNAIGKRKGSWALDINVEEANEGFIINHLISDLLPSKENGYRYSNSDPITGQAAWYDLLVKIEKVSNPNKVSLPQFPVLSSPVNVGQDKKK